MAWYVIEKHSHAAWFNVACSKMTVHTKAAHVTAVPCLTFRALQAHTREANKLGQQLAAMREEKARALRQVKDQQAAILAADKDAAAVKQAHNNETKGLQEQLTNLKVEKARALRQLEALQAALTTTSNDVAAGKEEASKVNIATQCLHSGCLTGNYLYKLHVHLSDYCHAHQWTLMICLRQISKQGAAQAFCGPFGTRVCSYAAEVFMLHHVDSSFFPIWLQAHPKELEATKAKLDAAGPEKATVPDKVGIQHVAARHAL